MNRYYRVVAVQYDPQKQTLEKLQIIPTSNDQSLVFPSEVFQRKEVINKIKSGDIFFISIPTVKRVNLQLFEFGGDTFIKTNSEPYPMDYIDPLPAISKK